MKNHRNGHHMIMDSEGRHKKEQQGQQQQRSPQQDNPTPLRDTSTPYRPLSETLVNTGASSAAAVEVDNSEGKGGSSDGGNKFQRVYVGNLAYSTSWQDLKDYMRRGGCLLRDLGTHTPWISCVASRSSLAYFCSRGTSSVRKFEEV
jgi:hypothetical protein